ncbi:hypothetical protein BpHYR1_014408 [Brachionus plicatilis]|uniref:Uncharacterized protein n=1 Tax=Brachionus plicatilis TaxID=10195 RepID=A0A3M7QBE5_BRAPC|nr:hypothetical protein BpHYR1_014408 [Brachionus plicatilis]
MRQRESYSKPTDQIIRPQKSNSNAIQSEGILNSLRKKYSKVNIIVVIFSILIVSLIKRSLILSKSLRSGKIANTVGQIRRIK